MTNEPRKTQHDLPAQPAADPPLVVRPGVILDLVVTADDSPDIVGGGYLFSNETRGGAAPTPVPLPYPT
jgi:hypothetical protein